MKRITPLLILLLSVNVFSRTFTVKLYDYQPSRSSGITEAEYTNSHGDIFNLTDPRMDIYLPDNQKAPLPCVMTVPGGGYKFVSARNEGSAVAESLLSDGIAVAILKYRLPNGHPDIPLADAQRAMEILRDSALQWGIDSSRIGVMGFSAGGHLAACLLTKYKSPKSRPDFGILVYPVVTLDSALIVNTNTRKYLINNQAPLQYPKRYSPINFVSGTTPPCAIFACQDDNTVPIKHSILFYEKLTSQHVPAELHIYSQGGHGWGFTRNFPNRYDFERAVVEWVQKH